MSSANLQNHQQYDSTTIADHTPLNNLLHHMQEPLEEDGPNKKKKSISQKNICSYPMLSTTKERPWRITVTLAKPSKTPNNDSYAVLQSLASGMAPKTPEYYNNEKYDDIICRPLKPACDGSAYHLISFLDCFGIPCQVEGWYLINFLDSDNKIHDIIREFTQISETIIMLR